MQPTKVDETDEEKVSETSAENESHSKMPKLKILSLPGSALSDETIVEGIPWGELRPMLSSKEANLEAFYRGLSKEDQQLLKRLDAA